MNMSDVQRELQQDGYRIGPPPSKEVAAIDAQAAEATPCIEDGGPMHYECWRKGSAYRAFAVCDWCGHAVEF